MIVAVLTQYSWVSFCNDFPWIEYCSEREISRKLRKRGICEIDTCEKDIAGEGEFLEINN